MDAGQAFLLAETAATIFMSGVLWTMQQQSCKGASTLPWRTASTSGWIHPPFPGLAASTER